MGSVETPSNCLEAVVMIMSHILKNSLASQYIPGTWEYRVFMKR